MKKRRLAYLPPLLRHVAEGKLRGHQDRPGAFTARQQPRNVGGLHAGRDLEQARRAEQGCKDDGSKFGCNPGANARLGGAIRPDRNRRSMTLFHGVFWMRAEVVGGMRFFYTQILEGSGLIAPLSNPDLTVTLIAKHS